MSDKSDFKRYFISFDELFEDRDDSLLLDNMKKLVEERKLICKRKWLIISINYYIRNAKIKMMNKWIVYHDELFLFRNSSICFTISLNLSFFRCMCLWSCWLIATCLSSSVKYILRRPNLTFGFAFALSIIIFIYSK